MMTRKDFEALATCMRVARPAHDVPDYNTKLEQWHMDCTCLAAMCVANNPRFDWNRFMSACNGRAS